MEIPKHVAEYMSKHGTNTGNKIMFYLLLHPESVTTKEISDAVGVSPKTINKIIRKMKKDRIIQDDGVETQKRRLSIPGATIAEPIPVPAPEDWGAKYDLLRSQLESLAAEVSAIRGENRTIMELLVSNQNQMVTPEIPKVTIPVPEITQSAPQAEPLNISLAAASLKEGLAANSSLQEFKHLFGVNVPPGADMIAVETMVKRKKAGKLDHIKAPLAYLDSISGKVAPPTAPATQGRPIPEAIDMRRIELEKRANEMWNKMGDGERKPFLDHGSKVKPSRYHTPIEALARSEFTRQILQQHGVTI